MNIMDWPAWKVLTVAVLSVFMALVIIGYSIGFVTANTFNGQRYDVVVTAQAVEKSTRFGDHTDVWAQVYGDQYITYGLIGHHDLEVGKTYHIVFVNRIKFHPLNGFWVWGEVEEITPVV
jgi:hypothetical protein